MSTYSILTFFLILTLLIAVIATAPNFPRLSAQKQVMLSGMLEDQGDPERWKSLILPAINELRMNYTTYPYNEMRERLLSAVKNQT